MRWTQKHRSHEAADLPSKIQSTLCSVLPFYVDLVYFSVKDLCQNVSRPGFPALGPGFVRAFCYSFCFFLFLFGTFPQTRNRFAS